MRWRAIRLEVGARLRPGFRSGVDLVVTHAPPLGLAT